MSYELRPLTTLSMTMDYIVTKVINGDRRDIGEWFDFVWNRTRAIRKVINIDAINLDAVLILNIMIIRT